MLVSSSHLIHGLTARPSCESRAVPLQSTGLLIPDFKPFKTLYQNKEDPGITYQEADNIRLIHLKQRAAAVCPGCGTEPKTTGYRPGTLWSRTLSVNIENKFDILGNPPICFYIKNRGRACGYFPVKVRANLRLRPGETFSSTFSLAQIHCFFLTLQLQCI